MSLINIIYFILQYESVLASFYCMMENQRDQYYIDISILFEKTQ